MSAKDQPTDELLKLRKKIAEEELKKIEWLLLPKQDKLKVSIPEYGDLTIINQDRTILDSVGKEVLNEIVNDYLSLLETSAAVYEKNGDYAVGIFSSEWCQFMDCSSRALCKSKDNKEALESGQWLCHESCWADASNQSIQTNQAVDIECSGGLHIYAIPIRANNEIIGSINFGYGNPPTEEDKLLEIAANFNVSVDKLRDLAKAYETRPAFIIDIAKEKLETSAKLIGNIVERKQMEEALLKSQKRYEKAQAMGHVGNWEYDPVSTNFWASDEAKRIYGYDLSLDNFSTELVESCIPEREHVHQALLDLLEHNKKYDLVFDILTVDQGIRKTIHSIAEVERDTKGNPLKVTGVISDISLQKKSDDKLKALNQELLSNELSLKASNQQLQANEQQLKAANQQLIASEQQLIATNQKLFEAKRLLEKNEIELKKAQEISHVGSFTIDFASNEVTWTEELYKIYGFNPALPPPHLIESQTLFTPESWELLSSSIAKTRETGIPYEIELNTRLKDGSNDCLWAVGEAMINTEGKIIGIWGAVQDITERKQAEYEIQKSEEKFRSIFENKGTATGIFGEESILKDCNTVFSEITGYAKSEIIDKMKWSDFVAKEDLERLQKYHSQRTKNGKPPPSQYECSIINKSGEPSDVIVNISLIGKDRIVSLTDITERKLAEKEIITAKEKAEESENKIKQIFENSTIVHYSHDLDNNVNYVSPEVENILGYTPEEIKVKWTSLTSDNPINEIAFQNTSRAIETGEKQKAYQLEFIHKNGKKVLVEAHEAPVVKGGKTISIVGSFADITERKKTEIKLAKAKEKVEESENRYKNLVEVASDGIYLTSENCIFIDVNQGAISMLGKGRDEIVGHSIEFVDPNYSIKAFLDFWKDIPYDKQLTFESTHLHKNGDLIPVEVSAKKYNKDNKDYYYSIARDITERKKTEIELIKAKEKAEESDRLKSAFLTNMSHEIRTPMNGILGFSSLLKEPKLSGEQQQKYIEIIEKSGIRMLNIINDIIDISKIEAGLIKLDITESDINEQIEYIYTFFNPEVEAKGMKLSFKNALPAKEAIINTDREKLFAILTNLVKNAIKYTNKGSIEFGYNKKGDSLEFFVKDTGIGIPEDRQKAIFDRFIQADIDDNQARQGAGLGLSISKAYVEMLGGKIRLVSEEGKGSTFYFSIPFNEIIKKEADFENTDIGDGSPKLDLKILIVEDDETSSQLLSIILDKYGKEIMSVITGNEAVLACRNNPDIGLILLDIQIPEMNGYEVARQIREFNKEVVIIAQTAYGLSGDREKAMNAGCNDYISKPINEGDIGALIRKYFIKET